MNLRTRLLLGYGYLVFLVILVAGSGIVGFFELSGGIERVLQDNVRSLRSTSGLLEALERQDSATLANLLDRQPRETSLSSATDQFETSLQEVTDNITSPEERKIIERLRDDFRAYLEKRRALLENTDATSFDRYQSSVAPAFRQVKKGVRDLLEHNHEAIVEADREAQQSAVAYGSWLGLLVAISLLSFVLLSQGLQRWFLERLRNLKSVADAVSAGDDQRRVAIYEHDELGTVAEEFNRALDRRHDLEGEFRGEIRRLKRLLVGLVRAADNQTWLFNLDGQLVADNLDETCPRVPESVRQALDQHMKTNEKTDEESETPAKFDAESGELHVEQLAIDGDRPAGWLVTRR